MAGVVSVFLGVALGVDFAFLGVVVAVFLALGVGAAFFFCTTPAVLAGPLVTRPDAVLAEIFVSWTIAGAWWGVSIQVSRWLMHKDCDGGWKEGGGNQGHTIAGVFFTRLVEVLAFALGAALAFVVLVVVAFFGAAFVAAVFVSVFLGLPAVLVPAGFAALVAFCEESVMNRYEGAG